MRANYMKTKSRSKSKRRRSLRKKSGGGIAEWFNPTPSNPADDALPLHKKALKFLTGIFSSAPKVPENVPPPPRPGQPPASAPVEPPAMPALGQQPQLQTAPMPAPPMPAPPMQSPGQQQQIIAPGQQQLKTEEPQMTAPIQPSSSPQFPATDPQLGSPAAFGGKRTKKRRNHKKK